MLRSSAVSFSATVLLLSQCAFPSPSSAQTHKPTHHKVLPKPPESCAFSLVTTQGITGSKAYVRLRYIFEALSDAQESVTSMAASLKEFDSATDPANALASLLTGTNSGIDSLRCAAAVIDRYPASDADDNISRVVLTSAFNREADAIKNLSSHIKEQFSRPIKNQTGATTVEDAERIAANTASQNQAATAILEVTALAVSLSVDLRDASAKTTEYLTLSCEEYSDILRRVSVLAELPKSAYTEPAQFAEKFLKEHKCRDSSH